VFSVRQGLNFEHYKNEFHRPWFEGLNDITVLLLRHFRINWLINAREIREVKMSVLFSDWLSLSQVLPTA
jgi:hypothetical protein